MGAQYVLITGTHENTPQVMNTLYGPRAKFAYDEWERLPGSYHGSGCTLASAIAGCIAGGASIEDAVRDAQDYTWQTLKNGFRAGMGQFIPDRFFWAAREEDEREPPRRKVMAMTAKLRGLYAITPECADGSRLLADVEAALAGGCRIVQFRDKLSRCTRARCPRPRPARTDPPLWRPPADQRRSGAGRAGDADGVHLGKDDGNLVAARAILGPDKILGASCYADFAAAQMAVAAGADYVAFGAAYPSPTKPACPRCYGRPVFSGKNSLTAANCAIGGITSPTRRR
jgi:thiamine monophosphate synthase